MKKTNLKTQSKKFQKFASLKITKPQLKKVKGGFIGVEEGEV